MKLDTLLSVYKINTNGTSTAEIKKVLPDIDDMPTGKTIATDGNNVPLTKYFMFNNMKLKLK
jgi:hypothetical protein